MKNDLKNIEKFEGPFGVTYRVRIYRNKISHRKSFDTLIEAIQWRDDTMRELKEGRVPQGEIAPGDMRLQEAADRVIMTLKADKSPNTIGCYERAEVELFKVFPRDILMSQLTPLMVQEYIDKRRSQDGVGTSKMRQELSFIRIVYTESNRFGVNIPSPELNIKRPQWPKQSREDALAKVIRPDQINGLLCAASDSHLRFYCYLLTLLYTGMRPSEAVTLRWQRLPAKMEREMNAKWQHIGYLDMDRGGFSRVGTKTVSRFVPIHPVVQWVVENLPRDGQYLFLPDNHGHKNVPYQYYRTRLRTLVRNGGVDGINFYSFRHTARSRMAVSGIQDSAAETILGHEGNRMVHTYTHYTDEQLCREIAKLSYA